MFHEYFVNLFLKIVLQHSFYLSVESYVYHIVKYCVNFLSKFIMCQNNCLLYKACKKAMSFLEISIILN